MAQPDILTDWRHILSKSQKHEEVFFHTSCVSHKFRTLKRTSSMEKNRNCSARFFLESIVGLSSDNLVKIIEQGDLVTLEPSITDGVHRNENFVEIIPVFSTLSNFSKKYIYI